MLVEEEVGKRAFAFIYDLILQADKDGQAAQINIGPDAVKEMRDIARQALVFDK